MEILKKRSFLRNLLSFLIHWIQQYYRTATDYMSTKLSIYLPSCTTPPQFNWIPNNSWILKSHGNNMLMDMLFWWWEQLETACLSWIQVDDSWNKDISFNRDESMRYLAEAEGGGESMFTILQVGEAWIERDIGKGWNNSQWASQGQIVQHPSAKLLTTRVRIVRCAPTAGLERRQSRN